MYFDGKGVLNQLLKINLASNRTRQIGEKCLTSKPCSFRCVIGKMNLWKSLHHINLHVLNISCDLYRYSHAPLGLRRNLLWIKTKMHSETGTVTSCFNLQFATDWVLEQHEGEPRDVDVSEIKENNSFVGLLLNLLEGFVLKTGSFTKLL